MKNNPTKQEIEKIVSCCKTITEASGMLGISRKNLSRLLKVYEIPFRTEVARRKKELSYPFVTKEWLIEKWVNTGDSLATIAKKHGISLSLLEYRASSFGLTKNRKYRVDVHKFRDTNDPSVWYLAGLIATDGYVCADSDYIGISMCGESEKALLEDIRNYFKIESPLRHYEYGNVSKECLRISFKGICEYFKDTFNIPLHGKTFSVRVPETFPSEDCAKAYILGCMDGDGCISHIDASPTAVLLTASEDFIQGIIRIIEMYSVCKCTYSMRKYPSVSISGRKNMISFLDWIYSTSCILALGRKKEKYLMVKDIVCSTVQPK